MGEDGACANGRRAAAIRGATLDMHLGQGAVSFCWDGEHLGHASHVEVTGDFNRWAAPGLQLRKYADGFFLKVMAAELFEGTHYVPCPACCWLPSPEAQSDGRGAIPRRGTLTPDAPRHSGVLSSSWALPIQVHCRRGVAHRPLPPHVSPFCPGFTAPATAGVPGSSTRDQECNPACSMLLCPLALRCSLDGNMNNIVLVRPGMDVSISMSGSMDSSVDR